MPDPCDFCDELDCDNGPHEPGCRNAPRTDNAHLAHQFLDLHFPDDWARKEMLGEDGEPMGLYSIHPDAAERLGDELLSFLAEVLSSILNAGSEREVTLENDVLHDAILEEIQGWMQPTEEG